MFTTGCNDGGAYNNIQSIFPTVEDIEKIEIIKSIYDDQGNLQTEFQPVVVSLSMAGDFLESVDILAHPQDDSTTEEQFSSKGLLIQSHSIYVTGLNSNDIEYEQLLRIDQFQNYCIVSFKSAVLTLSEERIGNLLSFISQFDYVPSVSE
jgi:hypothetical protein